MFNGDTYTGLEASFEADLDWAQDHLAILSGLYGVLRPLDLIQPYRLEMGTKLKTGRGTTFISLKVAHHPAAEHSSAGSP